MKKIVLIIVLAAAPFLLGAQTLPFLYMPTDARSAALGGAGVAMDADAWAMDNNLSAAALSSRHFAIGAGYQHLWPKMTGTNSFSLDGWYRRNRWAVGLSAKTMLIDYNAFLHTSAPQGSFTYHDLSVALGAAWCPVTGFAISTTARLVNSALAHTLHGMAVCADLAMTYAIKGFQVGLSVNNLGTRLQYRRNGSYTQDAFYYANYALPALVRAGLSYSHPIFTLTAEADYLFEGCFMACAGVEVRPVSVLSLRAGYHYGPDNGKGMPSFGSCGIHLGFAGLGIDVSYWFGGENTTPRGTICAGLSYSF